MRINTHCERAEATDFARLIHWRVAYFRVAVAAAAPPPPSPPLADKLCECGFQLAVFSESLCAPSAFYPLCLCMRACGRPPAKALLDEDKQLSGTRPKAAETLSYSNHPLRDRRRRSQNAPPLTAAT